MYVYAQNCHIIPCTCQNVFETLFKIKYIFHKIIVKVRNMYNIFFSGSESKNSHANKLKQYQSSMDNISSPP